MGIFSKNPQTPEHYTIMGKQLVCQHCSCDKFIMRQVVVHYAGELLNHTATTFICAECTHMHWFQASDSPHFNWE